MFVLQMKSKVFFIQSKMGQFIKMGSRKLHICPKGTKMGSIIGHRIDYNGVGALRGQLHIPTKDQPKYPPRATGPVIVRRDYPLYAVAFH